MDDLVKRLRDAHANSPQRIAGSNIFAEAAAALEAKDAELARLREALGKLHHAVCGETGFAACVRLDSGKAYPWPALDEADAMARAALQAKE